ncbi:hypothetical protein AZL_b01400 (plasmid) [Azospirillum sp. B510]|nr:hypothetical protein AZL_b01400 [Azospirillum sp. B510]
MSRGRLAGKTAIVTGAASGIGAATAELFAREGAELVVADIDRDGAEARAAGIRASGGKAEAIRVDLGDPQSISDLLGETVRLFGGLDILYNNAAATQLSSSRDSAVEDMDIEVWDALMRTNLRGTMLAIKCALPALRRRGKGVILNASSVSAQAGAASFTAYATSKTGIETLTRYVAVQHGKDGIRCNAIAPGLIVTPATASTYAASGGPGEIMRRHQLVPRFGCPDDVAATALFLASDEAEFITGQVINVDGGYSAVLPFNADMLDFMKRFNTAGRED